MRNWLYAGILFFSFTISGAAIGGTAIDLTNSGVQITGSNTLLIRNVNVPGAGKFQYDLIWDASNKVFVPIKTTPDTSPKFTVTNTTFSFSNDSLSDDIASSCQKQFGLTYTWADWTDLVSSIKSKDDLSTFLNSINDPAQAGIEGKPYLVLHKGKKLFDSKTIYFVSAYSPFPYPRESILGGTLSLQITSPSKGLPAICVNRAM